MSGDGGERQGRGRRGGVLTVTAIAVLAGPLGVVAPMALTLLVVAGGVAGLWEWLAAGRPRDWVPVPLCIALAVSLVWGAISALWAAEPAQAAQLALRLTLLMAAGLMLIFAFRRLDADERRLAETAMLAGFGFAVAALLTGFAYAKLMDDSLWGNYFFDPLTTLNNGAVVVSLLLWPVTAALWRRGRVPAAVVVAGGVLAFLSFLSSGAALLAPAVGGVAFLVVRAGGFRGNMALAVILALLTVSAPYLAGAVMQSDRLRAMAPSFPPSAQHRLRMWDFVIERIDEKPLWGWGLDGSRSLPQEGRRLAPNMEVMPLHPHNASLQVRLELGLPGAAIAAALVFIVFKSFVGAAPSLSGAGIFAGAGTAYLTVGALSYGVWQNWWIGVVWILACLAWLAVEPPHRRTTADTA